MKIEIGKEYIWKPRYKSLGMVLEKRVRIMSFNHNVKIRAWRCRGVTDNKKHTAREEFLHPVE